MSQIRDLRKACKLDEAYELGLSQLENTPDDIWVKRDYAWVCYDLAKHAIESSDKKKFFDQIDNISKLKFGDNNEPILADSIIRLINKWGYDHIVNIKNSGERVVAVKELIIATEGLPKQFPSEVYSSFVRWVHRCIKGDLLYVSIMRRVGLNVFSPSDYRPIEFQGKKIMPLAEQVFIAYAKGLLMAIDRLKNTTHSNSLDEYMNEARTYLDRLEQLLIDQPEYQYTLYYIVKIMQALGDNDKVVERLIPFVRKKSKDFWVWQTMAKAIENIDKDMAMSCCCKGLLCRADEDKIVGLREQAAIMFANKGFYNEAKTEIEIVASVRQKYWGKGISNDTIMSIIHSDVYKSAKCNESNIAFYHHYQSLAEELVYGDDAKLILITFVNRDKQIAHFITIDNKIGFFSYKKVIKRHPMKGEIYKVVWGTIKNQCYIVSWCKKYNDSESNTPFYKQVDGDVDILPNRSFGFVNDYFIPPEIVAKHNLHNGDAIKGIVIKTFDKKKERFGWALHKVL